MNSNERFQGCRARALLVDAVCVRLASKIPNPIMAEFSSLACSAGKRDAISRCQAGLQKLLKSCYKDKEVCR